MERSIERFNQMQKQMERERKQSQRRLTPVGGRGIDSFYDTLSNYYQEADEDIPQEEESDDEDVDTESDEEQEQTNPPPIENDEDNEEFPTEEKQSNDDDEQSVETDGVNGTLPDEQDPSTDTGNIEEDPMETFGQHGGDDLPNNQYDPKEIAKIMQFVSDEAKSLSDYVEAAKTSRVDILQRLYSDIADEERYHMEQLLFAKAEITGEEYKPHDPDIRKEYEELLSMGMDESSAMATAVDKFNLHSGTAASLTIAKTDGQGNVEELTHEQIQEAFEEVDRGIMYMDIISFVLEYSTDDYIIDGISNIASQSYYQEELAYSNQKTYSKKLSLFGIIGSAIVGLIKLIKKICGWLNRTREKISHRIWGVIKFIKHHKLKSIFQHGVMLYFWNDKTNTMDVDGITFMINMTYWLTHDVVMMAGLQNEKYGHIFANNTSVFVSKKQRPSTVGCFKNLQAADLFKTKLLVTDQTQNNVAEVLFTTYDADKQQIEKQGQEIISQITNASGPIDLSIFHNYYAIIDVILQVLNQLTESVKEAANELEGLQNSANTIYNKDINKYNQCVEYMSCVVKALTKVTKACTSDIETLNGLMEQVGQVDAVPVQQTSPPTNP